MLSNWSRNVVFEPARLHRPACVEELQDVVASAQRLRVLGTAHSFNHIADTPHDLVSVLELPRRVELQEAGDDTATVTVSAGLRYGELAAQLDAQGWALPNMGSLPHISIAGACSTGTHGSGQRLGCLASSVAGVELVDASGELHVITRDDPDFAGHVVALGCLGVITAVTLEVVPSFQVAQTVYDALPRDAWLADFDALMGSAYSVSGFTTWGEDGVVQLWCKARMEDDVPVPERLVPLAAKGKLHPLPGVDPVATSDQLGVPGPWFERLPHFRLDFTPSAGDELQTEYFVDAADAVPALEALEAVRRELAPAVQISEIRTVAADDLWLSMAHERDSVCLHFTWVDDMALVTPAMAVAERALAGFAARPHWGKLWSMAPQEVMATYPRLDDFRALRARLDPQSAFVNDYAAISLGL